MSLRIELRWSDDDGKNWTPWRIASTYRAVARFRKLGSSKGRILHTRVSGAAKRDLLSATAVLS